LHYGVGVEDLQFRDAALRGAHAHMLVDELQLVAVACEDERVVAVFDGVAGERAHQVVRFEALLAERWDAHRLQQLARHLHLRAERFGRLAAVRFVFRECLVAKSGRRRVEHNHQRVGLRLLQ
jgi:hypothetical protein